MLNFFVEAKNPDRSATVVKRQACFNGVLSVCDFNKYQIAKVSEFEMQLIA